MSSPADDCGVTGGCQACPLFAAKVCGDPAPGEQLALFDLPDVDPDVPDVDPDEPKPEGAGCCGGGCSA
ncbi:hypothetical protein Acy02nite_68660 [Actinoplanes cyaneus]|uniref:Uncharacterized protein n=1 Tax=Actinoplanes cyaneus TaxID=52696 RepID=A0A919IMV4_9ACTN|nr:hypothetical protein [Actinoplanes cyaneus]MCW2139085.1 hypothetical protein [Actinoplanes cyaneus]GID68985.1 hypothetical protein Acy02nite_68660 [Actinoplanes cyaneus]